MKFFLGSLSLLSISIFLLLLTSRWRRISTHIFLLSLTFGCISGIYATLGVLANHHSIDYRLNLRMVLGEFYLGIDSLSAFFLLMVYLLFFLSGIYGTGYLLGNKEYATKNLSIHYALYHFLCLSILVVVTAKNAILFLIAWELMALSSYFLIIFKDEKKEVTRAGYLYLIATHTGTFCLWILFLLMGYHSGSLNFEEMSLTPYPSSLAGLLFILALVGFGVKAGLIPFHIWLPHAHPAAPSHISAVLSGVLIKTGIYGLMRILWIIKDFPEGCAILLLFMGMISGLGGVLYALGQHEIKKLLAYHSIENIGIILLGLGIGLWGKIHHNEGIAAIGYAGALLHTFNHAIFKGLLFLSAGSLIRATHTGEIDRLGGLLKYLPWTGHCFLIGSLSICGLPLFNGFISEWLVFQALFQTLTPSKMNQLVVVTLAILSLALIGGLALACFTKAFGAIFLGHPRFETNTPIKENPWRMSLPMVVLSGICLWIGLFPRTIVSCVLDIASTLSSLKISPELAESFLAPFLSISHVLLLLILVMAILTFLKKIAMKFLPIQRTQTWGCGYSLPTPRMQYTASSFAEPLLQIFRNILGYQVKINKSPGYFPKEEQLSSRVRDVSEEFFFLPLYQCLQFVSRQLKIIQYGYTQLYLLYIFIFLLALLLWKMF